MDLYAGFLLKEEEEAAAAIGRVTIRPRVLVEPAEAPGATPCAMAAEPNRSSTGAE